MKTPSVDRYLKDDRQWPRHLRLAHARYQRSVCKPDMAAFWDAIIERNNP